MAQTSQIYVAVSWLAIINEKIFRFVGRFIPNTRNFIGISKGMGITEALVNIVLRTIEERRCPWRFRHIDQEAVRRACIN